MLNSNMLSYDSLNNYIITAPPGTGKTTVAIDYLINSTKPGLKIFLVPFRALADEIYDKFRQNTNVERVVIATGDYKEPIYLQDNDILVATSEKFLSLLIDQKIGFIDKIVIDEFQLLNSDRGKTIEQILVNLSLFYPEATVLLLSGTIRNPEEISGWLTDISNRKYEIIREENAGKIKIEIIDNFYEHEKYKIMDKIIHDNQDKLGILFFNTKAKTINIGKMFGKKVTDCSEHVDDYFSCPCIYENVAFHNSSLFPDERRLVENRFRDGKIKVIAATSTISAGVNLPANYVVVADVVDWKYNNGKYDLVEKTSGDILQMSFRCGRLPYTTEGIAYVLISNEQKSVIKDYPDFIYKIKNNIADEVKHSDNSVESLLKMILNLVSLFRFGIKKEILIEYLNNLGKTDNYEESIKYLKEHGFIVESDNNCSITQKGRLILKSTLSIDSLEKIFNCVNNTALDLKNEYTLIKQLSEVYNMVDGFIDQNCYHYGLMIDWIENKSIIRMAKPARDVLTIRTNYNELLRIIINTIKDKISKSEYEFLKTLSQRLEYGVLPEVLPIIMKRQSGIGRMKALKLSSQNIVIKPLQNTKDLVN